jgi:adenylate cyclase
MRPALKSSSAAVNQVTNQSGDEVNHESSGVSSKLGLHRRDNCDRHGLVLFAADSASATSRALAATLGLIRLPMLLNVPIEAGFIAISGYVWTCIFSVLEGTIVVASFGMDFTDSADGQSSRVSFHNQVAIAARADVGSLVWGDGYRAARIPIQSVAARSFSAPIFFVFAVPFFLSVTFGLAALVRLFGSDIDPAERVRLRALAAAIPFLAASVLAPLIWKPATIAVGETVFL